MRSPRLRSLLLPAAVGLLLAAAPARAQAWSDPGLGFGLDALFSSGRNATSDLVSGGVHVQVRLTGVFGAEATVSIRKETLEAAGGPVLDVKEIPVTVGFQAFFFPSTRFQPYLYAGAGYCYARVSGAGQYSAYGDTTEHQFMFLAGGGLEVRPSRRTGIRADLRYAVLDLSAVDSANAFFGTGISSHYLTASAGFTVYF